VGDTNIANQRIAIGRGLATIRGGKESITEFLRLLVQKNTAELIANSGTGMFSSITGKNLKEFKVLMPPLGEQKRIVDVVSSVDAYIDALQQQADSARKARKALEVAEFDNQSNEVSLLGDYCDKSEIQVGPFGSQLHAHEYVKDGIPVVMPKNIIDGRISEINIARVTQEKTEELGKHMLQAGDVLFARRGDLSKRALVSEEQSGWLCGTGTVRVRSTRLSGELIFRLTNTAEVNAWLMDNSVGATMPNLNTSIVGSIPLRIPKNASDALRLLDALDAHIGNLDLAQNSAKTLRSGLLSDLLSGNHEIPASYDSLLGAA
jgi:type I restriction enzyme S subunit